MTDPQLQRRLTRPKPKHVARLSFARTLIEHNLVTPWQLFWALQRQSHWDAHLSEILKARDWVSARDLRALQAQTQDLRQVDLTRTPPARDAADLLPPKFCLKHNVVPWARIGKTVILVTGRPHNLPELRAALPPDLKDALFALSSAQAIADHVTLHHRRALTEAAENAVARHESCRSFDFAHTLGVGLSISVICFLMLLAFPSPNLGLKIFTIWTILTLLANTGLRIIALLCHFRPSSRAPPPPPLIWSEKTHLILPAQLTQHGRRARLPRISMLVPLYKETEIASALIARLTRLSYPRALLDVVLFLEEKDHLARATVARTQLPRWMQVIEVPSGSDITTKPRALNYALPFCRGDIIGIWDAEDAPAPDQLEHVAHHFAHAPPDVACLQGVLDYYNPYTNWLSRCFAIEYAAWFRLVLPTLRRLGFAIPLGGTTLFLRRNVIEEVGGWDSHNVTEDADLGMRLARRGYRTELIPTVTYEEANCHMIAWVRQRSRWLKGYMAIYLVHMRSPRHLFKELGALQFLGFQLLFLCTISQFLLAPFLWWLWGAAFGVPHPLIDEIHADLLIVLTSTVVLAGSVNGAIWIVAVHTTNRPRLYPWIPSMLLYFPLATLAAYKGLLEMVMAPFYWDKTSHGKTKEATKHDLSSSEP